MPLGSVTGTREQSLSVLQKLILRTVAVVDDAPGTT